MQTGEYFSQLVGTQVGNVIKPHVRKNEKVMSSAEYAQYLKDRPTIEQEMLDAITVESQAVEDFKLDAADVKSTIERMLKNAGTKYTKNQQQYHKLNEKTTKILNKKTQKKKNIKTIKKKIPTIKKTTTKNN